jgi:hypothetical protein
MEGLLSLLCGEKVVMRTKIVASATAAGVLLMNVATTAGQPPVPRGQEAQIAPMVVADNSANMKRPLVADLSTSLKRPMIAVA